MQAWATNEPWVRQFQLLLDHHLPSLENTAILNVAALSAVAAGLMLVFRGAKLEKTVVLIAALVLGSWGGYEVSLVVGTPGPITSAVGAVAAVALGYKTHKWWLAIGSVIVLFLAATVFQLGRGDLERYVQALKTGDKLVGGPGISSLPSAADQARNLHPGGWDQLAKLKEPVIEELKELGPAGWLLPVAAAVLGVVLAVRALYIFSAVWLGLAGAGMAMAGACVLLSMHWPPMRGTLIEHAGYPFYGAVGVWLLGLIMQAKKARIPKAKAPAPAEKKPADAVG